MSIENVKKQFNFNPAGILAKNLDWADGKSDKKISASVWNEFVKDKGGKTIKYSISEKNAVKSISVYLERKSKETGKNKVELMMEWLNKINEKKSDSTNPKLSVKDLMKAALEKSFSKTTAKDRADKFTDFLAGKSDTYFKPSADSAAQEFHQVIKNLKGKVPLNLLGIQLYLMDMYPALVKQAQNLGIKAPKVSHSPNASVKEINNDILKACVALKNQILAAERNKAKKV